MLYDALERVYTVVAGSFDTDLAALCAIKGVTAPAATVIVKRQTAELIIANRATQPTVGLYAVRGQTQMARGGLGGMRDTLVTVGADYVITGPTAALIQKQIELGAETLVKEMCERVPQGAQTSYAGGLADGSVVVELLDGYTDDEAPNYIGVAHVTVPIFDRDNTT